MRKWKVGKADSVLSVIQTSKGFINPIFENKYTHLCNREVNPSVVWWVTCLTHSAPDTVFPEIRPNSHRIEESMLPLCWRCPTKEDVSEIRAVAIIIPDFQPVMIFCELQLNTELPSWDTAYTVQNTSPCQQILFHLFAASFWQHENSYTWHHMNTLPPSYSSIFQQQFKVWGNNIMAKIRSITSYTTYYGDQFW